MKRHLSGIPDDRRISWYGQRGFTTLELVVVLLCVGILVALLLIYRN